jgi:predicted ATPase with chaperone activity
VSRSVVIGVTLFREDAKGKGIQAARQWAHRVFMLWAPGAGTSSWMRGLSPILPAMRLAEALGTTRIHRVVDPTRESPALTVADPGGGPP